ncbi:MAG: long-chain acyl-CoA synthetase [Paracoccaceae bacterium]|jgi:long-chain acyl-CoA synthetase
MTAAARPFPWEKHYAKGVVWDAPIAPMTLPQMLRGAIEAYGPHDLFDWRGTRMTYAEFGTLAGRVASALAALGLSRGDAVALHMPNHIYHPAFFFGAMALGCRIVHLSPLDAVRELEHKLNDSEAKLLVTLDLPDMQSKAERLLAAGVVPKLVICDDVRFGAAPLPKADFPDMAEALSFADFIAGATTDVLPQSDGGAVDDVALLQYTGGTTGAPKGAMLSHGNLTSAIGIYDAWYEGVEPKLVGREVVLCVLPLFHIYALTVVLLRQIRHGGLICLRMRFDATETLNDIETQRITAFAGVPTMWIALVNHPEITTRDLSSMRIASSGGAPLPNAVGRLFRKQTSTPLLGGWGMTETSPAGTAVSEWGLDHKEGSIGVPLPQIEMRVVSHDDPTAVLPAGEIGEIAVRGPNVTKGYWNRDKANAESFADGFFLTGDVGRMDEDGFFYLVDRKSDLILSGGFNVYPQVVEQALHEHPAVAAAGVIGIPDDYRGESAKAFIVLRAGATAPTLEDMVAFLQDRLGRHEMPRAMEIRDTLPVTAVGKLSRKDLRAEETAKREAALAG